MIRLIVAEHDDIDAKRLHSAGLARGLDVRWFKLGLDSEHYSIRWRSGSLPLLTSQDVELNAQTLRRAKWVFHKEARLRKRPYVGASVGEPAEDQFCQREWSAAMSAAFLVLKSSPTLTNWTSSFLLSDFTDYKLFLLDSAINLGIAVPDFVVGTTFEVPDASQEVVVKAINADEIIDEGRYFPTSRFEPQTVKSYMGQRSECPSLVQSRIEPKAELRATYVNGSWVLVEIARTDHLIDVRYAAEARMRIVENSTFLPTTSLQRLCKLYDMSYCVFDVLVDQSETNWLVDVTPNGSWYWYEDAGNVNITEQILNALEAKHDEQ